MELYRMNITAQSAKMEEEESRLITTALICTTGTYHFSVPQFSHIYKKYQKYVFHRVVIKFKWNNHHKIFTANEVL